MATFDDEELNSEQTRKALQEAVELWAKAGNVADVLLKQSRARKWPKKLADAAANPDLGLNARLIYNTPSGAPMTVGTLLAAIAFAEIVQTAQEAKYKKLDKAGAEVPTAISGEVMADLLYRVTDGKASG
jgi:hypothetical protein